MEIRHMLQSDIPEVYAIGTGTNEFSVDESSNIFWPVKTLERWVNSKDDISLVAYDGKVKAFLLSAYHEPTRKAVIENVWVSSELRCMGLGRKLMAEAERRYREMGCEYLVAFTEENNAASTNMCIKQGYSKGDRFNWMIKVLNE